MTKLIPLDTLQSEGPERVVICISFFFFLFFSPPPPSSFNPTRTPTPDQRRVCSLRAQTLTVEYRQSHTKINRVTPPNNVLSSKTARTDYPSFSQYFCHNKVTGISRAITGGRGHNSKVTATAKFDRRKVHGRRRKHKFTVGRQRALCSDNTFPVAKAKGRFVATKSTYPLSGFFFFLRL